MLTTQLRLLGDVEACVDGCLLDLGHPRQRSVLGALLIEPNRPVAVDQLVDRVWADHPPQRARETLYSYLSRLRHLLSALPEVRITRRSNGYLLAVDPLIVDLHMFRHLIGQARAAPNSETSLAFFDEALDLWRGPALAGMDTPWLNGVRRSLEAERFAAVLARNDLALACGQHAGLVGPLTSAVSAHPFDERVAGQLMLALFLSGRRGDALDVYREIRRRLVDELGTDPGADLQRLHRQVLTGEGVVTVSRAGEARMPIPQQLPRRPLAFSGRLDELAQLDALAGRFCVVVLAGMPGVGKSPLALHWAHRVRDRYPTASCT